MVLKAFRCQRQGHSREREILMAISEELFYQGRYIWLRSCREVRLVYATATGENRIRYRLVSTKTLKCLPLKQKESQRIELTHDTAIAALPVVKGRRRTMFLFMHPSFITDFDWDCTPGNKLSPEEVMFLIGQTQTPGVERIIGAICRFRNLIDEGGGLTREGRRILVEYINTEA
jgi:hypothetical protein